jgi:asparagine synthase (glutamine-hydrolysing)
MCGICGMLRLPGGPPLDPGLTRRMADRIAHRGPDDAGEWMDAGANVALGHRRLSIVDLSPAGHNPMANEDGTVWITYNGEVYNHAELRPKLEAAGHRYRSRTDTETIIHLYEECGDRAVHQLRGMFAFALWDGPKRRLLLVRDRLGIKPLYYAVAGGHLIWGSEVKAILAHPAVTRELDESILPHYLTFAATPAPFTLFKGIFKLPAGHQLVVESDGTINVTRWWSPAGHVQPNDTIVELEGASRHLSDLLVSAVTEQTMADVPHGLLLSGGVDSSLILSILSRHMSQPVRTFSVGFDGADSFDERPFAAQLARHFGAEHRELVLAPEQVQGMLPELIVAQDEPIADWVCLPLRLLSKLVRDSGVIVVQVGEGSDEIFAGYPRYRRYARLAEGAWPAYARMPRVLRRAVSAGLGPMLDRSSRWREAADLFERAADSDPLFVSGAVALWDREKRRLLSSGVRARQAPHLRSADLAAAYLKQFQHEAPQGDFAAAMAYQDLMVRLPELLLMRVDKMTMQSSIEARVPFLDHRLVEWALALPQAHKLHGMSTKHVLRHMARGMIPADVIDRPKRGFDVPLSAWLRERELGSWAENVVMQSGIMRRDLFVPSVVRGMFRSHREGRRDEGFRIWNLVNLCAWYDHWIA